MGLGVSLLLIAVGAVLTWAVHPSGHQPVNVGVVGVVLMLVGFVGFLLTLFFWDSWAGFGGRRRTYAYGAGPDVVVDDRPRRVVRRPVRRTTVVEEDDGPVAY